MSGYYMWLPEPKVAKAGTPPPGTPLRSNDIEARLRMKEPRKPYNEQPSPKKGQ